jgi:hypothetical protein
MAQKTKEFLGEKQALVSFSKISICTRPSDPLQF